jgi:hypothetical protein
MARMYFVSLKGPISEHSFALEELKRFKNYAKFEEENMAKEAPVYCLNQCCGCGHPPPNPYPIQDPDTG